MLFGRYYLFSRGVCTSAESTKYALVETSIHESIHQVYTEIAPLFLHTLYRFQRYFNFFWFFSSLKINDLPLLNRFVFRPLFFIK